MKSVLSLALGVLGIALAVFPASSFAEEIDDGVFKWLYASEIKRIYMDPVPLSALMNNPASFLNVQVKLRVRFNRIESGLAVSEYTSFGDASYLNFSVWDSSATLWEESEMKSDFPFMFIDKSTHEAQQIVRLRRFDIIEVYGSVVSLYENKPWFEVNRIWLKKESELSNTLFAHIRLAEDMYEKGAHDLVVGEIDRILGYDLSEELAGQLLKRKGFCLLILKKYAEAEIAYNRASSLRPRDPEVYRGWGESMMKDGRYETALWALSRSLVFQAKQDDVYAMMGYCRAKVADARIQQVIPAKKDDETSDVDYIRRREKQVRPEFDPGTLSDAVALATQLTQADFEEVQAQYELSILDCRKALFINPANANATQWRSEIEKRLEEFKKLAAGPPAEGDDTKTPPPPGGSNPKGPPPPPK